MEAVLSGITLALLSALGAFAFKFPHAYMRLYPYLLWGASIVFILVVTWQVAIEYVWISIKPFLDSGVIESARLAKNRLSAPYVFAGLTYGGFVVFLWAIRRLPQFISDSEHAHSHDRPTGR
jgi:hypothetical protein